MTTLSTARDFATQETLKFLEKFIPGSSRILEVGCGRGDLAKALQDIGHRVIPIDPSAKAVAEARSKGIDAVEVDLASFIPQGHYDVVLFTRSLHHIFPLPEAIIKAKELLRQGGTLLIDEFALEVVDAPTAIWRYEGTGVSDPLSAWKDDHAHEPPLHTGEKMIAELKRHFEKVLVERCPYLYRYCVKEEKTLEETRSLFQKETELIRQNEIRAVGLRMAAWVNAR